MFLQLKSLTKTLVIISFTILTCYGTTCAQSISQQVPFGDASDYAYNTSIIDQGWTWLHTRVAVNPATNRVYIPHGTADGISRVIEVHGSDNSSSAFELNRELASVGVNPKTNRVYFADLGAGLVEVFDGNTGNFQEVPLPQLV